MPANKKYLTRSATQRLAKISAGLIGGYMVTVSLHMALALWVHRVNFLMTLRFGGFILWAGLLIIAFLAKSGWKIWVIYLLTTLIFLTMAYVAKMHHPIP